jgi:hypothetical protein
LGSPPRRGRRPASTRTFSRFSLPLRRHES